jgi:membrane-associated phospholipid phosphatase
MAANPWFSSWNYDLFHILFSLIPHSNFTDDFCKMLLLNPLMSTWIFAVSVYRFWWQDDKQRAWRRRQILSAAVAFGLACLVTLVLRPWIHWPAPVLNPAFKTLFPADFWGNGNENCFPSHSTLAYFTISVGFWPLSRTLSLWLSALTLLLISFPRVYVGGHYPIDVLFSCFLSILMLLVVWHWPILTSVSNWLPVQNLPVVFQDVIVFLCVFEFGEGFRGVELLVGAVHHAFSR